MSDLVEAIAEVPLLIQDTTITIPGRGTTENRELKLPDARRDRFMDGPATRRLAVVDFDPATGRPVPTGVRFVPFSTRTPTRGRYEFDPDPTSPGAIAVNAFGTVFDTVRMFEAPAALGREVRWAFGAEQLLIVPRAGQWANAFYDRSTRSLQFFWFDSAKGRVYTALSRDIVAHECGHALLDAVVPSLYDSITPQSMAIHESIADLVAVLMALRSSHLRSLVLSSGALTITGANPLNRIAEQFGMCLPSADAGRRSALRELHNDLTIDTVGSREPHQLSAVLSGVFYDTLAAIFEDRKRATAAAAEFAHLEEEAVANRALGSAQGIFARLLLRAIDYLPPGDLSFADVGRAALAADRATDVVPPDKVLLRARGELAKRFRDRGIVKRLSELNTPVPAELSVPPQDLVELLRSDWAAYRYVEQHRDVLGVPDGAPFTVLPRVDATKRVRPQASHPEVQRELIIKVAWSMTEPNAVTELRASSRRVPTGVTIALRWNDGVALALVRSDAHTTRHRKARDAMLQHLAVQELITHDERSEVAAHVRVVTDIAEITATHQLLHLAGDWE